MRQFVKLSPSFWVGTTGRALRKSGRAAQLVALYFISSPHTNYCGIYRVSLAYAAADLAMSQAALLKLIAKVEATGFLKFDRDSSVVWVVNGARWQIGDCLSKNDKKVKAVQSEFDTLPRECPLRAEFFAKYSKAFWLTETATTPPKLPRAAPSWNANDAEEAEWRAPHESEQRSGGLRDI